MSEPKVYLVDDDAEMLKALGRVLGAKGFNVRAFASAKEFIAAGRPETPGCLVLDVAVPGINGLDLQERLSQEGVRLPVIFLTGNGDIPMSVRAMKAGAVDFLTKPVDHVELTRAVTSALAVSNEQAEVQTALAGLTQKYDNLTPREREVFAHVITGRLNKQIATHLGTSEQTVKVHRMRITAKLGVSSAVELAEVARKLGVRPAQV